jgi:hypothetical protein
MSNGQIAIQHASMRGRRRAPLGFDSHEVTTEQMQALEGVAVSTFADMVSNGHTFQAALAAVYYSGVVHALEMQP